MGLFKNVVSVLSSTTNVADTPAARASSKPIEEMSLQEIIAFIRDVGPTLTKGQKANDAWIDLTKRLYRIALYENHVSHQDRAAALMILEGVKKTVEQASDKSPQSLAAYRKANALMESEAKIYGLGSLAWKLKEHAVANADMIPFVMRLEHGPWLANFLHMMSAETLTIMKPLMVKQLVWTRRPHEISNAVLVLHGLACTADPAIRALFTQSDLVALRSVHNDYNAAREVLVRLGLLPGRSNAKSFSPQTPVEEMVGMFMLMLKEEIDNRQASISHVEFTRGLSEEQKVDFGLAEQFLDFYLAIAVVKDVYGEDIAAEFRHTLGQRVPKDVFSFYENMLRMVERTDKLVADQANLSVDFMILDSLPMGYGRAPKERTEDEFNIVKEFLNKGAELLTAQRITLLDRFRFLLRFMAESHAKGGTPQLSDVDKATLKELDRLYYHFGSEAGLAEASGFHEDWIGSGEIVSVNEIPGNASKGTLQ